ncbi:MAG: DUF1549 domain-containing protein, partial [Planctomycetales bacterium]|nr:DUF1549 domain-containing protein [Planctomycetales bacterium]
MKINQRTFCVLCWITGLTLAAMVCSATAPARGAESLPEGLNLVAIESYPERIELTNRFDYRQVLITGRLESGETVDLTRMVEVPASPKFVKLADDRVVRPVADGEETLTFRYGDRSVDVPVKVSGADSTPAVSFVRDVQPALSRMSCNAGTCHGAKDGKVGFKLSLRGYDALYDHRALTDDVGARRFNRAAPEQSLILLKATGSIPHVGGVRTHEGDPYYEVVKQWIASGAKLDLDSPRVTSIEIAPHNPSLPRPGMKQQMVVLAHYSDGATRDVTKEAFVESGNIEVIEAEEGGLLKTLRRGEAPVLVRYEGAYAATTITVMGDRSGFVWSNPPTYNYIDERVYDKLQRVKILPSEVCSDAEFVRRVYIDLTGLPPTGQQAREFIEDPTDSRTKRDALVDQLVGSREFVEYWTNKWADLLQVNRKFLGEEGSVALRNWIKNAVATNKPYDEFAYEIITASGSTIENPPASYYKVLRDPDLLMENTTHLFLAVRF